MAETPAPSPEAPTPETATPAPETPTTAPEATTAFPEAFAPAPVQASEVEGAGAAPPSLEASPVPDVREASPVLEALEAVDPGEPRVAATLEVPPLPAGALPGSAAGPGAAGGEWDLLMGKVQAWLEQNDLPGQWERLGGPLRGLGVLLGLLLVLKLYVALLDTLDDVPLMPRLLQLVGLIAALRFSLLRLTRSGDRQAVLDDWKRRWDAFRGA